MLGFLLIDKPAGMTSHDVVYALRRKFNIKRLGHAGTLDPGATGLLVMGIGPATRCFNFLALDPKEYTFEVRFGRTTTTYDDEGEPTSTQEVPTDIEQRIIQAIPQFLGDIIQLPPMFSAVKKDGKPLYTYARKGVEVERAPRQIHISELELLNCAQGAATMRCLCSTGTYVRSLAHDIGQAVGCGAHASNIRRTRAGAFHVDDACRIEDADPGRVISLERALEHLPSVRLDQRSASFIRDGRTIGTEAKGTGETVLLDPNGAFMGIGIMEAQRIRPKSLLPKTDEAP